MNHYQSHRSAYRPFFLLALPILFILVVPVFALGLTASPQEILAGLNHPLFLSALILSAQTSCMSLAIIVLTGSPLAWWLSTAPLSHRRLVELLVDLPIVLPPAVVGIALLQTFGRNGLFGPLLESLDVQIAFSTTATVIAQTVVSAPFYIQSACSAFSRVDPALVLTARTLGQSPTGAFLKVTVPIALPGLISGAALAWARALGEFGATLLFAGNLSGTTQTLPLAIYTALESDIQVAVALALVLALIAILLLLALRGIPSFFSQLGIVAPAPRAEHR